MTTRSEFHRDCSTNNAISRFGIQHTVLTAAIGGTAGTALWISADGLRAQAEEAGWPAAVTAATSFVILVELSTG